MEQLYKIDNKLLALVSTSDPLTGEIDGVELERLEMERDLKQQHVALYIKSSEMGLEAIDNEIVRLKAIKQSAERRVDWLKMYLQQSMETNEISEINFGVHTIKIKKNPPSVQVFNEDVLGSEFKTQIITTKVDKTAIKKAIQSGRIVHGAELVQSKRLEIK
jgi:hypothetical protein